MPRVLVTAEVNNLDAWEKGFRTHGDLFKQMGVSTMEYATAEGNRIAVCGETNDLDAYLEIFNSPATAEAMAADGVKRETVRMFVLDKTAQDLMPGSGHGPGGRVDVAQIEVYARPVPRRDAVGSVETYNHRRARP